MKKDFSLDLSAEELVTVYIACSHCLYERSFERMADRISGVLCTLNEFIGDASALADSRRKAAQGESVK